VIIKMLQFLADRTCTTEYGRAFMLQCYARRLSVVVCRL